MEKSSRNSRINRQITFLTSAIIVIALFLCCLVNELFLSDFYESTLKRDMVQYYDEINNKAKIGTLYNSEFLSQLGENSAKYDFSTLICTSNGSTIYCSDLDSNLMLEQMRYILFDNDAQVILGDSADNYDICNVYLSDSKEYLVLIGTLCDGNLIFFKSDLFHIQHTAMLANRFLLYTAIGVVLVASIISFFTIAYFTKPFFGIIDITKRISNFDFSVKYKPQKIYNEIDDLGEHINEMATTLERAIKQLRKANDSLKHDLEVQEETENMRKEFISNVSHELKTPIALIQGYAEGLQEGIMDDPDSRNIYLDVIIDESNKMNRLVREMLILNQLEAGQMESDMVAFDVTNIVNGVIDSNKIYFEGQSINFSFDDNEPCMVVADEFLVEQVFTNFMSNAIHYVMNENVITVRYEFAKKGKVRISVFNSGNNIPKKDIKRIWDKFYKVDKARSREYGGSGIGLSVVKAVMELLHEKYGVENLTNGVEFWFELSLAKDEKIKQNS